METIALNCEEPLFIKNLENVQGDERDVILFSVGYGPDADGKVSMNFGPLNRVGGERRLNVAVSRARYEMIIYSTLRADQIDLNRSSAIGVAGLKRFLEYAEKHEIPATARAHSSQDGSLAEVIARALNARGYEAHTNIGCSGYRIDVGIVDQQHPSKYILGILCDGKKYRRTKTVRDREIVQNGVLGMLGWNIFRIWTMDWWERQEEVIAAIEKAVTDAEQGIAEESIPTDETAMPSTESVETLYEKPSDWAGQSAGIIKSSYQRPPEPVVDATLFADNLKSNAQAYKSAVLLSVKYPSDEFMLPKHERLIMRQIDEVVNLEAPISRPLLCKRILSAWGISRLGPRLDTYLGTLLSRTPYHKVIHEGVTYFWKEKAQMDNYAVFRTNSGRDATDLPPEEVANAIKQTLEEQISLPTPDLARLVAQLFGYARMGTNVEAAMYQGIKLAVAKGAIKVENSRAKIVTS